MKHAAEPKHNISKNFFIFLILIIICIIGFFILKNNGSDIVHNFKANIDSNDKSEKELELKSLNDPVRDRYITFSFDKKGKLIDIKTIEQYNEQEKYDKYIEQYSKRVDIEVLETLDEDMKIVYHKIDFGTDANLNYNQIKEKYLSIAGAYEVIE